MVITLVVFKVLIWGNVVDVFDIGWLVVVVVDAVVVFVVGVVLLTVVLLTVIVVVVTVVDVVVRLLVVLITGVTVLDWFVIFTVFMDVVGEDVDGLLVTVAVVFVVADGWVVDVNIVFWKLTS